MVQEIVHFYISIVILKLIFKLCNVDLRFVVGG